MNRIILATLAALALTTANSTAFADEAKPPAKAKEAKKEKEKCTYVYSEQLGIYVCR
jgi:hypothetical protein